MIYDHIVKVNDEYYPAGIEVPDQIEEEKETAFSNSDSKLETEPVKRGRPKKS